MTLRWCRHSSPFVETRLGPNLEKELVILFHQRAGTKENVAGDLRIQHTVEF